MINLLPEKERILVRREYLRRFIVIAGIFSFSLICIAIILLFPSYFLMNFQEKDLEKQLSIIEEGFARENADAVESSIKVLNSQLSFLKQEENLQQISFLIYQILGKKQSGVKLNNISYRQGSGKTPDQIFLQGFAPNRDALSLFIKNLEQIKSFSKVQVPISNFLREQNIDFNISIDLVSLNKGLSAANTNTQNAEQ